MVSETTRDTLDRWARLERESRDRERAERPTPPRQWLLDKVADEQLAGVSRNGVRWRKRGNPPR